ncbi:hypothetical protein [Hydrogenophaga sp. PBL-H3]|uniref:hypothetical protein n=1 Tax=Hydrogenophaga sp. PBL-H3 TaxID=434010 RepID=UPI00131F8A5E|nr:hypothetical protein [Hydrogenophaga sp. PBL-H3]QHE78165.1 hypothetical protein F9Z45_20070 [Hydrogenophaga sp. PBL-H3]QHE82590.1 hypothetical protein F9Z44_20070 [Hydrogenophaga sp. PBL-H3]
MPIALPSSLFQSLLGCACAGVVVFAPLAVHAQGFTAYVAPPRFEVQATPGQPLRQVLEIQHVGQQKGKFRIYTSDWTLNPDNSVTFSADLSADSCRPWVAIERRDLVIEPGARYRYRFEITPPPGTAARECRFAIMVEGLDTARAQGTLSLPVGGRIGVIVYAAIGDAAPQLEIAATRVVTLNGKPTAVVDVRNRGNAHGRLEGFVNGTDATGARLEMTPSDLPILAGETRAIAITAVVEDGKPAPEVRFPLTVKGTLEWGKNRLPLDASFAP